MEELGSIENLRLNLDKPMALSFDIEYRALNLMTGLNGTGKSLIMKIGWAFGNIMAVLMSKPPSTNEAAQYIMDKTFEDQNFHGEAEAKYKMGNLLIAFDNGKVTRVEYYIDPKVKVCAPPLYMSTKTRTYTQINQYLKMENYITNPEGMLEFYRLYDVVFVSALKAKIGSSYKPSPEFRKTIKESFKLEYDFDTFGIDNGSVHFKDKDGKKTELSTLSDGEQSLINMTLVSNW